MTGKSIAAGYAAVQGYVYYTIYPNGILTNDVYGRV
jgi:hypothetical protein